MINIHIGLDLSFNSTGITFYNEKYENNNKIESNIEFHRLVRDKENTSIILNVNQHIYFSQLLSIDLDLKHKQVDSYVNALDYSNDQIDLTEKYYISVKTIMKLIITYINNVKSKFNVKHNEINIFINMEGSILSGYNFNVQIGVNMLQGFLRGELIKLQLANNFNTYKFRMIPPTLLKSFFTNNGSANKEEMVNSFINNYNGRKLIPQIDLSNKMVDSLNDVVDSFALVVFNVYDLIMSDEKYLFNIKKEKLIKKKIRKKRVTKVTKIENLIDSKILEDFNITNIQSNILLNNGIIK